jgi:hypothetical protein
LYELTEKLSLSERKLIHDTAKGIQINESSQNIEEEATTTEYNSLLEKCVEKLNTGIN